MHSKDYESLANTVRDKGEGRVQERHTVSPPHTKRPVQCLILTLQHLRQTIQIEGRKQDRRNGVKPWIYQKDIDDLCPWSRGPAVVLQREE